MSQQTINVGTVANDGTGDLLRDAFVKANANFAELYAAMVGVLTFRGSLDCSGNPNYPVASKGDSYVVSVAGKVGGALGTPVDAGDLIVASANNAGGTQASVGASWFVVEHNLQGALLAANNLSDVANAGTARANLGLGTAAVLTASAVLQAANNLSDLGSASVARTNLGLGSAALLASNALLAVSNNLSDVANAGTARSNLGLAIGSNVQAYSAVLAFLAGAGSADASGVRALTGTFGESAMSGVGTPLAFKNGVLKTLARTGTGGGENLASGTTDLAYTVPSGKKAVLLQWHVANSTGSTINAQFKVKISSSYYPLTASNAVGASQSFSGGSTDFIMTAGMTLAITTTGAGLTAWPTIIEFDATSGWKSAYITSFASGDNTLYTNGTSNPAFVAAQSLTTGGTTISVPIFNGTGATRTISTYAPAPGVSSSATTNRCSIPNTIADQTLDITNFRAPRALGPGESLLINSDASGSCFAWLTVFES